MFSSLFRRGAVAIACLGLFAASPAAEAQTRAEPAEGERGAVFVLAQANRQQNPSPFEDVPEAEEQKPATPFEDVTEEAAPKQVGDFVEEVSFRGARRIPREGLLARIFTKEGDPYDEDGLRRDFMVLWNTGYFDDLRLEVEDGECGKIIRFVDTIHRTDDEGVVQL